jgi:hypothetical protein
MAMKNDLLSIVPSKSRRIDAADFEDDLLRYGRAGWAWEFLRLNPSFRQALATKKTFKRCTVSNITTIEATACAPEVRNFGICFHREWRRPLLRRRCFLAFGL